MAAPQDKTMKEGFLKGEEIPVESSFVQILEMENSAFPHTLEMKQSPLKVLSSECKSDELWLWLKPSKPPTKFAQVRG